MANKVTKEMLINEFLSHNTMKGKKAERMIARIEEFVGSEPDNELLLILHALYALKADNSNHPLEQCYDIATPAFEMLEDITNWGYVEFNVLSVVISFAADFNKAYALFQEAVSLLNDPEYLNDSKYKSVYKTIHYNFTLRILRARYYEPDMDVPLLRKLFKESSDYIIEVCQRKNLPQRYVMEVRRAVFANDMNALNKWLDILEKIGERKWYKTTMDEILEFVSLMRGEMSKPISRALAGYLMRKRRMELGLSISDLAEILKWDNTAVAGAERASDGVSIQRLRKVAHALGVTLDYFCGDETREPEDDPFMSAVKAYTHGVSDADKEYILDLIKLCVSRMQVQQVE